MRCFPATARRSSFGAALGTPSRTPSGTTFGTTSSRYLVKWLGAMLLIATLAGFVSGCASGPPNPNPHRDVPLTIAPVDLPRYMGRWYVIANVPYFAERDFVGSYAEWSLRPDGKIDDSFYGHKSSFDSKLSHYQFLDTPDPASGNGKWKVRLFWPISVTQLTLYVSPDYRYTLLGYPNKRLGWIFSRDPEMSDATYQSLLARLDAMGYDTSLFQKVAQRPEQLGLPGYQQPNKTH